MAEQIILEHRVLDANGDPLSGAKLYAYIEGTSALEPIYTTSALSTAHPSPLVSDAGGNFPQIWHAGDHGVKISITDASDVELSWSPLDPCPMTSSATTASNISFTPTADNPATNVQQAIENATQTGSEVFDESSGFTIISSDVGKTFRCTSDLTISFTQAANLGNGFTATIIADGGKVTVDPNGLETVNGVSTETLYDGESGALFCDGSALYLVRTPSVAEVVIASGTISGGAVAQVAIEIPTEFEDIEIEVSGYAPVTDGDALGFQSGTGTIGSPTWQTTYAQSITANTGGTISGAASAPTYLQLAGVSNAAGGYAQYCKAQVKGFNVSGFLAYTAKGFSTNTTPARQLLEFGGAQETTSTRTLMRLIASTGNIKDLEYKVTGKRA